MSELKVKDKSEALMIRVTCELYGKEFEPDKLEGLKGARLTNIRLKGELAQRGKYRNSPLPYGACTVSIAGDVGNEKRIITMAELVYDNLELFRGVGADDITFNIVWEGIQGNMQFSAEELQKIARLNIPLNITYVLEESEE